MVMESFLGIQEGGKLLFKPTQSSLPTLAARNQHDGGCCCFPSPSFQTLVADPGKHSPRFCQSALAYSQLIDRLPCKTDYLSLALHPLGLVDTGQDNSCQRILPVFLY